MANTVGGAAKRRRSSHNKDKGFYKTQAIRTQRNKLARERRAKRRAERKKEAGTWEPYGSLARSASYKFKTAGDKRRKAKRTAARAAERRSRHDKVGKSPVVVS